jgi:hypothetical protein
MKRIIVLLAVLLLIASPAHALLKNIAGQTIAIHLWDATGGDVTSGTTTCYTVTDGGTESAGATATHEGHGTWSYAITQAETNGEHIVLTCTNAAAVTSSVQVYTVDELFFVDLPGPYTGADAGAVLASIIQTIYSQVSRGVLVNQPTLIGGDTPIKRGDVKTLTFNLGTDWPLTGRRVFLTAKNRKTDDNADAVINREATVTDAVNGIATITLTAAETATVGRLYYDVTVTDTDGTSNPGTAQEGTFSISHDVRQ